MGSAFGVKSFERDESIIGQGKNVLTFAKKVNLSKYELDRLFHEFLKYEDPNTHLASIENIFKLSKASYNILASVIMQIYEEDKTGTLSFLEFVISMWAILSSEEIGLASLCYNLFDIQRTNSLDIAEIRYLIYFIWDFKPSKSVLKAIKKLELNIDSVMTLEEFLLLCKHHPYIIQPLLVIRKALRKRIVFPRYWKQIQRKRVEYFDYLTILDIRFLNEPIIPKTNYQDLSMKYLNLRPDVPKHFIEQWKLVQKKKEHCFKGNIQLPYELFEKKDQSE